MSTITISRELHTYPIWRVLTVPVEHIGLVNWNQVVADGVATGCSTVITRDGDTLTVRQDWPSEGEPT